MPATATTFTSSAPADSPVDLPVDTPVCTPADVPVPAGAFAFEAASTTDF